MPANTLQTLIQLIDRLNDVLGRIVSWATLLMVLVQFGIVLVHYIFREGSIFLQESLLYMHSLIFLGAGGYTLLHNSHVRVDVIYSHFGKRGKAWVDLLGTLFFLFPVCGLIGWTAWPFVVASWETLEGSMESSGIQAVFILKSFILIFVTSVILQGLSLMLQSLLTLREARNGT